MDRLAERCTTMAALVALMFGGFAVAATPADADDDPGDGPRYAPTMLILDASGSMQRPDPAGTMMTAAKNAVRSFVASAPAEARVGLSAYGTGTGNADAEKSAGCRDTKVLHPPTTLDRAALTRSVEGIEARGWTPMGAALRQAAEALPGSGPRSIVLVSDGEDTCAPPEPCEVARELKQQGVDLVLHTIGFAVDAAARTQLSCMAQATGGTYTDAADGRALARTLPRVSAAALRNYTATGRPVAGTPTHRGAPVIGTGQYLDTIGPKETRYYAVTVPAGATAYFSGTVSFPRVRNVASTRDLNVLETRVYGADGKDCNGFEFEQGTKASDGAALTVAQKWDGATKKHPIGLAADTCSGGGTYKFAVTWSRVSDGVPERLPIELLVGIEPGVTDPGPEAATSRTAFTASTGPETAIAGGGSFNVAAALPGSGNYVDTLAPGEFVFYRVKLDWGQGLAYRVILGGNGTHGVENVSNVRTTVYSPLRETIGSDFSSYTGTTTELSDGGKLGTPAVRYRNRTVPAEVGRSSLPGWYYIAVKVGSTSEGGTSAPVPVRLSVSVAGDHEPGPTYGTPLTSGIFEASADTPAAGARSGPAPSRPSAVMSAGPQQDSGSDGVLIGVAVAAGVAVCAAVVGGVLWRRRRRS
ncbi:vWA domain-containing protein [Speluncibacter jeojiensis]|uniref:vWA domain-containing protein n=1 Tax=Speluncibacter jeojiensis TaxID=2710754 RepID=UPI0024104B1E|nr:VWA domain-containing protein [Rhodococcus sp. D2-41]